LVPEGEIKKIFPETKELRIEIFEIILNHFINH